MKKVVELKNLKTKTIGQNAIHYKKIDSTQKEIWRQIENQNAKSGDLITADIQTNGIGTHRQNMAHRRRKQCCIFTLYKNRL